MSPRETIAHYRISSKLGEGGMGAVYRATDTKLNRDVAIKVLPDSLAADPDRLARFTREAQVLASLNHPNIAAIYGVEERALVLELVEGPTLAERIAKGAIPIGEALPVARQIAEALEYAHEKQVIHRDLKPANIKITPEGRVKVLDFGLAKALTGETTAADPAFSPTLTMRATMAGVIMGTAGYMSPEQAKGKPADRRADIWAFGVLLVEMLTGRALYSGETVSETLASVIKDQPNLSGLPDATPARVRRLLQRCLDKDPQRRLQAIGEARITLDDVGSPEPAAPQTVASPAPMLPWILAAALAILLCVTAALFWIRTRPVEHPLLQFSADLGPDATAGVNRSATAISPDGSKLVFASRGQDGTQRLSIRSLNQPRAVPLPGTDEGFNPFFSPDSQWVGFFARGKLKKVSIVGGAAVTLCDAPSPRGGSWGEDGVIIAALGSQPGLSRVPDTGGLPQPITKPADKGERIHRWPQILPGGKAVLFTSHTVASNFEEASIAVLSLKTGQWKIVHRGAYDGHYLRSGHLLYMSQGTIFGVKFDLSRLEITGPPTPLWEDVSSNPATGQALLTSSDTGILVYRNGRSAGEARTIAWLDRSGKLEPLPAPAAGYVDPHLSPDGKWLGVALDNGSSREIWMYDLLRQNFAKITFAGQGNREPVWAPDSKHIVYDSTVTERSIWWMRADGAGEPQLLLKGSETMIPYSFSPDGRVLAYSVYTASGAYDIWMLPLDMTDPDRPKPGKPELFLGTAAAEISPSFSPDGRWIAYESNESGAFELYVRPYRGPGGKWLISSGGGVRGNMWSRNGRELIYATQDGHVWTVSCTPRGDSFTWEKPRMWPGPAMMASTNFSTFDLSADGKRLLIFPRTEASEEGMANAHVTVLLNFFDEVQRRVK